MAAARRWRLAAPGKGNRDDPLANPMAVRVVLVITILAILSAATGAVALASSTGTLNVSPGGPGPTTTCRGVSDPQPCVKITP